MHATLLLGEKDGTDRYMADRQTDARLTLPHSTRRSQCNTWLKHAKWLLKLMCVVDSDDNESMSNCYR